LGFRKTLAGGQTTKGTNAVGLGKREKSRKTG
jgi:hypothetical protein